MSKAAPLLGLHVLILVKAVAQVLPWNLVTVQRPARATTLKTKPQDPLLTGKALAAIEIAGRY